MRKEAMDAIYHYIGKAEEERDDATKKAPVAGHTAMSIVGAVNGLTNAVLALTTLELERQLNETEVVVVNRG